MFYDANPQGPIEKMLLDRLASLIWRLRRAGGIESELLSIVRAVPSGAASPDDSAHEEKMSIMLRVASQTKPKEFNQLEWLQQYESHLDRAVHRALAAFQRERVIQMQFSKMNPSAEAPVWAAGAVEAQGGEVSEA